jgi:hypothetical protein
MTRWAVNGKLAIACALGLCVGLSSLGETACASEGGKREADTTVIQEAGQVYDKVDQICDKADRAYNKAYWMYRRIENMKNRRVPF